MAERTRTSSPLASGIDAGQQTVLRWTEYGIEAVCLGLFMMSVCLFAAIFEHPDSPIRQAIEDPALRRVPMGLAMGLTAAALIYSPMGQRSGAHMNPATTLAFLRLGKVRVADALAYVLAQLLGGIIGVQLAFLLIGQALRHPAVNFVTTIPGPDGAGIAFLAELSMSALMMLVILAVSNRPTIAKYTGISAGLLIMIYIVLEAPLSRMSLNPARTLGSALAAGSWSGLWVYFTAPTIGMLLAAETYQRVAGHASVRCAKLHHPETGDCHFHCDLPGGYDDD